MPHDFGSPDRIVHDQNGGGSGDSVTVTNFPSDYPDAAVDEVLSSKLDPVTPAPDSFSTMGDNTFITSTAPNGLRILWLYAQAGPLIIGSVLVTFKLGATDLYTFSLEASQPFAHSAVIEGAAGDDLIVNLDSAKLVYVNADYRLYTP